MQSTRTTRQRLRADYASEVRVRCGRCQRVLGRLYGDENEPRTFSNGRVEGILPPGARIDYFRRHRGCSADSPASWEKLVGAYRRAAAGPSKRERVITVPLDLR